MNLAERVQQEGFAAGYLLPVPQYEEWTRRRASGAFAPEADWIEGDPAAAWPWANGLLLLIWPYAPYAPDTGLSGYYPASHQSYHAMMGLKKALEAVGVRAERAAVPVKSLLVAWGLAACLDSDMLYMPGIGTRFVIQALMVALPEELTFTPKQAPFQACIHCKRCQRACPGGAISPQGYDWRKCLRAYEDGPRMPQWVMEKMTCLLGCEVCQDVCPLNPPARDRGRKGRLRPGQAHRRGHQTSPGPHRQKHEEGGQAHRPGGGAGGQPKQDRSAAPFGGAGRPNGRPPERYPPLGNFQASTQLVY